MTELHGRLSAAVQRAAELAETVAWVIRESREKGRAEYTSIQDLVAFADALERCPVQLAVVGDLNELLREIDDWVYGVRAIVPGFQEIKQGTGRRRHVDKPENAKLKAFEASALGCVFPTPEYVRVKELIEAAETWCVGVREVLNGGDGKPHADALRAFMKEIEGVPVKTEEEADIMDRLQSARKWATRVKTTTFNRGNIPLLDRLLQQGRNMALTFPEVAAFERKLDNFLASLGPPETSPNAGAVA